jgi:hypothetical protein
VLQVPSMAAVNGRSLTVPATVSHHAVVLTISLYSVVEKSSL